VVVGGAVSVRPLVLLVASAGVVVPLIPDGVGASVPCTRCGDVTDARLGRYLVVVVGRRGRQLQGAPAWPRRTTRSLFCGPCADQFEREFGDFCAGGGLWYFGKRAGMAGVVYD